MSLQLWDLGIFKVAKPIVVEIVPLQSATEFLEGTATHAKDGKRLGNGIVIPQIDLGVKGFLIFFSGVFLIKPRAYIVSNVFELVLLYVMSVMA